MRLFWRKAVGVGALIFTACFIFICGLVGMVVLPVLALILYVLKQIYRPR